MAAIPKFLFLINDGVLLSNAWGHESRQKAADLLNLDFPKTGHLHNFIFNVYKIGKRIHECFDAFVSSGELGMRKPGPGIFQLAIGIGKADAFEGLLNQAAPKPGINTCQHKDHVSTHAIIKKTFYPS